MDTCDIDLNDELEGFDLECGKTWIYPTNLPIRDYQYNIVKEALFKNTMVCLPTGLGKTFIAAVIMFNYYRWYPGGKIIFMAPTKPLVGQQMDACFNITAIPREATAELTGSTGKLNRNNEWTEKRVFFITPQVLQNDIHKITELGKEVKCLVFDEAHRARGNYAYCEVIRQLIPINKNFRVLALSATPGGTEADVIKVCKELLIANIELRTEQSLDVSRYVFKRSLETIVVDLGPKITEVRKKYIEILDKYMRPLVKYKIINGNYNQLSKGRIFYMLQEHKKSQNRGHAYNEIGKCLNIGIQLYHAFDLLIRHGLRGFYKYFEDLSDKPLLKHDMEIKVLVEEVKEYLGPIPCIDKLPDGSFPKIPEETVFGHPKFYQLQTILKDHFARNTDSKAIVFCEFVESVIEAYTVLIKEYPLIKPSMFLGQKNIAQRKQIEILDFFRKGLSNVLVSTCIGEEGLDIGEVDLVICFDINNKSTVRMVQRMGRTGRKREGRVVVLVTEGKEHSMLQECLQQKNSMNNQIMHCKNLQKELYSANPKMIPDFIKPTVHYMYITVSKDSPPKKKKLKNGTLNKFFKSVQKNEYLCDVETMEFNDRIPKSDFYFAKEDPFNSKKNSNSLNTKLETQRNLQSCFGQIGSSCESKTMVSLLSFADARRFNIPLVRTEDMSNGAKKQGDIRTMFLKQTLLSQSTQVVSDMNKTNNFIFNNQVLRELNTEISNANARYESEIINNNCAICKNLFPCNLVSTSSDLNIAKGWVTPSTDIFECLTEENMDLFLSKQNKCNKLLNSSLLEDEYDDLLAQIDEEQINSFEEGNSLFSPSLKSNSNINESLISTPNKNESVISTPNKNESLISTPNKNESLISTSNNKKTPILEKILHEPKINSFLENTNSPKHAFTEKDLDYEMSHYLDDSVKRIPTPNKSIQFPKSAKKILKEYAPKKLNYSDFFHDDFISEYLGENSVKADTVKSSEKNNKKAELSDICNEDFISEYLGENSVKADTVKTSEKNNKKAELSDICNEDFMSEYLGESRVTANTVKTSEKNNGKAELSDICNEEFISDNLGENRVTENTLIKTSKESNKKAELSDFFHEDFISEYLGENGVKVNNNYEKNKTVNTPIKQKVTTANLEEKQVPVKTNRLNEFFDESFLSEYLGDKGSKIHCTPKRKLNNDFISKSPITKNNKIKTPEKDKYSDVKKFFKVNSFSEIFKDDDEAEPDLDATIICYEKSPLENILPPQSPESPILSSYRKATNNKLSSQQSILSSTKNNELMKTPETKAKAVPGISPDLFDSDSVSYSPISDNGKLLESDNDIIEILDSTEEISPVLSGYASRSLKNKVALTNYNFNINDTKNSTQKSFSRNNDKAVNKVKCNLNNVYNENGLTISTNCSSNPEKTNKFNLTINDICDNSIFDILDSTAKSNKIEQQKNTEIGKNAPELITTNINVSLEDLFCDSDTCNKENKSEPIQNQSRFNALKLKKVPPSSTSQIRNSSTYKPFTSLPDCNRAKKLENKCMRLERLNESLLNAFDSEEEFETASTPTVKRKLRHSQHEERSIKKTYYKNTKKIDLTADVSTDDEFGEEFVMPRSKTYRHSKKLKSKRSKPSDFLDLEARVSSDEEVSSDERCTSENEADINFVNDETENLETSSLHLEYIKSTRSPLVGGKFKIPVLPKKIDKSIFSQVVKCDPDDTYMNDSFCVDEDDPLTQLDLSELELAELKLKEMRKLKKRKSSEPKVNKVKKKRRIIVSSDDSD